jgi:hypothetical protein
MAPGVERNTVDTELGGVSHIIQLAIAPVFLLTGVGSNMAVLSNRLARIIDRSRVLEDRLPTADEATRDELRFELELLLRRGHIINRAFSLSTACALLVCLVIASLFVGGAFGLSLPSMIAVLFVVAMLCLVGSFCLLLREIVLATDMLARRARRHAPV